MPRPNGQGSRDRVTVPCGKCYACLSRKRSEWSFRLTQELKRSNSADFLTLTYSDEKLPLNDEGIPNLNKGHLQAFLKRLRTNAGRGIKKEGKLLKFENNGKLSYYLIGEYGPTTIRPHYHGIFFNLPVNHKQELLDHSWNNGFISCGSVTPASIAYVTKYCITKNDFPDNLEKPFALISKKPFLGSNYVDTTTEYHREGTRFIATVENGVKVPLPRLFRDKIFTGSSGKLAIKANLEKCVKDRDKRIEDFHSYVTGLNLDPFEYELNQKIQSAEILKKRLTKNSKL